MKYDERKGDSWITLECLIIWSLENIVRICWAINVLIRYPSKRFSHILWAYFQVIFPVNPWIPLPHCVVTPALYQRAVRKGRKVVRSSSQDSEILVRDLSPVISLYWFQYLKFGKNRYLPPTCSSRFRGIETAREWMNSSGFCLWSGSILGLNWMNCRIFS